VLGTRKKESNVVSYNNINIFALANVEWSTIWTDVEVTVLACRSLDHHPLLISLNDHETRTARKNRLSRVDAGWSKSEEFHQVVIKHGLRLGEGGTRG
jgi:hypothetical protein